MVEHVMYYVKITSTHQYVMFHDDGSYTYTRDILLATEFKKQTHAATSAQYVTGVIVAIVKEKKTTIKTWQTFKVGDRFILDCGSGWLVLVKPWFARRGIPARCLGWHVIRNGSHEDSYKTPELVRLRALTEREQSFDKSKPTKL